VADPAADNRSLLSPAPNSRGKRRLAVAAMLGASLLPVVLFFVVRPQVGSDAIALGIAGGAPVVLSLVGAAVTRRTQPLALLVVVAFGLAVAATLLTGGSSLPFKLYRPLATGVWGLTCLVSVAVRRPVLLPLARVVLRRHPDAGASFDRAASTAAGRRKLTVITAVMGAVFLVEGAMTVVLAFSLPTDTYLIVSRLLRWGVAVVAIGVAVVFSVLRRHQAGPATTTRPKRSWFGRKGLGVGVRPQTWQGWLLTLLIVGALVVVKLVFHLPLGHHHL
jgi:hypothetical protein